MTAKRAKKAPKPPFPWGKLLVWTAALSAPPAAALFVLAMSGRVAGGSAVVAWLAAAGGIALLVAFGLRGFAALKANLEAVGQDIDPEPVGLSGGVAGDLAVSVARSHRRLSTLIEALEAESEAAQLTVDSLPAPLVHVDRVGAIVGANKAARKLLGKSIVGRRLSTVIRDPLVLGAVEKNLSGLGTQEAEFTTPDLVDQAYQVRVTTLPPGRADGASALLALQDVTAAKRIDQMRADFIANVSHELRTPLSTLIGFIETLSGPASDDAAARERFLTIMHEEAERMFRLIRDLMSLSRIEMHEHTPPTDHVDVIGVVQSVTEILQLRAGKKDVRFRLDMPSKPVLVVGDHDELTQVFQNLIDNAVKYGPEGSTVIIKVKSDKPRRSPSGRRVPRRVRVAVTDEGEGIAPEHIPRLTERFYRVDAARSRAMGGTGLGLAIVKHIVNRHGGRLDIESRPPKGSTFKVVLTAAPKKARVTAA